MRFDFRGDMKAREEAGLILALFELVAFHPGNGLTLTNVMAADDATGLVTFATDEDVARAVMVCDAVETQTIRTVVRFVPRPEYRHAAEQYRAEWERTNGGGG